MNKILIAGKSFSFNKEPRIINQIYALKPKYDLIGLGDIADPNISIFYVIKSWYFVERLIKLTTPLGFGLRYFLYRIYLKIRLRRVETNGISLIIANNLENGIIAILLNKPFVFDSHEYLIGQFSDKYSWWKLENSFIKYLLKKVLSSAKMVTAEGDRVLTSYSKLFNLPSENLFCTPNTPKYHDIPIKDINSNANIRFIHHGLASPRRGLDFYIKIFQCLPENYTLTLMLNNIHHPYYKVLKDMASSLKNIYFLPPVPYENIVKTIAEYDVSLVFFNSNNDHHKYMTVPNKFWESLQARLPVIVNSESAMADIVKKYSAGFICKGAEVQDYVDCLKDIDHTKIKKCHQNISKSAFNFSKEIWIETYRNKVENIIKVSNKIL